MADKTSLARSKASLLPPHINVSVPAVAAATPPDTGASIMLKPFSFAAVATALTEATSMVLESINKVFLSSKSRMPACWLLPK